MRRQGGTIKRTNLILFGLALLALLLRPYLAYQLTLHQNLTKDPVAVNNLLQRLIKKKEEHHAFADEDLSATIRPKSTRPALAMIMLLACLVVFRAVKLIPHALIDIRRQHLTRRRYYLSYSGFRI